ncbi:MAG: glycoside hydrolase, partial [Hyphomicrobiales bacterium]|nr:glycoside hydrolase [Hyphomicrobiales bacterium]
YKNLDSRSAVISIEKPVGWDLIADAGSAAPGSPAPSELPPRERAQAILDAYLEAIRFENGRVNPGYLKSLGLTVP